MPSPRWAAMCGECGDIITAADSAIRTQGAPEWTCARCTVLPALPAPGDDFSATTRGNRTYRLVVGASQRLAVAITHVRAALESGDGVPEAWYRLGEAESEWLVVRRAALDRGEW